jgi:glutamine synthetase adenylyltransferase
MNVSFDPAPQAESDYQRLQFVMGEVATCSSLTALSTMNYEAGDRNFAEQSLGYAEEVYAALMPLVLDSTYSKQPPSEEVQKFTVALEQLRERLDRLQRFRKWPTELNGKPVSYRGIDTASRRARRTDIAV